jgi:hypothetical protein
MVSGKLEDSIYIEFQNQQVASTDISKGSKDVSACEESVIVWTILL